MVPAAELQSTFADNGKVIADAADKMNIQSYGKSHCAKEMFLYWQ